MLQRGCKSMKPTKPGFPYYLTILVLSLAKAPLKAWGSPQTTAEQRDGEVRAEKAVDGQCRLLASVRLILGLRMVENHSCYIPWKHPLTASL